MAHLKYTSWISEEQKERLGNISITQRTHNHLYDMLVRGISRVYTLHVKKKYVYQADGQKVLQKKFEAGYAKELHKLLTKLGYNAIIGNDPKKEAGEFVEIIY